MYSIATLAMAARRGIARPMNSPPSPRRMCRRTPRIMNA
jgi:hypothetical protein